MAVPKYDGMFQAVISSLKALGGSASIDELEVKAAELLKLSEKDLSIIHKGNRTEFSYRLAWARTYLKNAGLVDNSERGVWSLTNQGEKTSNIDPSEIKKITKSKDSLEGNTYLGTPEEDAKPNWEDQIISELKLLSPNAFERLTQRILRESGFTQVEITGKSGDGGIDGTGVIKLNLLSFHVNFQCKRYKDAVGSDKVRDFRGAMVGRSDKGLIITTGRFTEDAKKEASRDGAPPLELIDGNELAKMLKHFKLGVDVQMVESVEVNKKWFEDFNSATP